MIILASVTVNTSPIPISIAIQSRLTVNKCTAKKNFRFSDIQLRPAGKCDKRNECSASAFNGFLFIAFSFCSEDTKTTNSMTSFNFGFVSVLVLLTVKSQINDIWQVSWPLGTAMVWYILFRYFKSELLCWFELHLSTQYPLMFIFSALKFFLFNISSPTFHATKLKKHIYVTLVVAWVGTE